MIEITEIQIGYDKRRIKDDKAIYSDALNDALQQYLKKEEATSAYQPKGDYLTSIPEEYVTEEELNAKGYLTEHQDISNLATKEELSSKADTSAIADMATKTWVGQQGFLTQHQDISQPAYRRKPKCSLPHSGSEAKATPSRATQPYRCFLLLSFTLLHVIM